MPVMAEAMIPMTITHLEVETPPTLTTIKAQEVATAAIRTLRRLETMVKTHPLAVHMEDRVETTPAPPTMGMILHLEGMGSRRETLGPPTMGTILQTRMEEVEQALETHPTNLTPMAVIPAPALVPVAMIVIPEAVTRTGRVPQVVQVMATRPANHHTAMIHLITTAATTPLEAIPPPVSCWKRQDHS